MVAGIVAWTSAGALLGVALDFTQGKYSNTFINGIHGLALGILKHSYPDFYRGAAIASAIVLIPAFVIDSIADKKYHIIEIAIRLFGLAFGGAIGVALAP